MLQLVRSLDRLLAQLLLLVCDDLALGEHVGLLLINLLLLGGRDRDLCECRRLRVHYLPLLVGLAVADDSLIGDHSGGRDFLAGSILHNAHFGFRVSLILDDFGLLLLLLGRLESVEARLKVRHDRIHFRRLLLLEFLLLKRDA